MKRAIRVIYGNAYRDHTNPIFKQLQTLKLNELVEYNILKTMYKAHHKMLPVNLQNRFIKRESTYNLRGMDTFVYQGFRTKSKERCISIQGVKIWNNLDDEFKISKSLHIFKTKVKLSLLRKYDAVL